MGEINIRKEIEIIKNILILVSLGVACIFKRTMMKGK